MEGDAVTPLFDRSSSFDPFSRAINWEASIVLSGCVQMACFQALMLHLLHTYRIAKRRTPLNHESLLSKPVMDGWRVERCGGTKRDNGFVSGSG